VKFYISFGQSHAHRVGNHTYDCDSLMLVEAPDEISARIGMNTQISNRWCGIYAEDKLPEVIGYFPRGVINEHEPVEFPAWQQNKSEIEA